MNWLNEKRVFILGDCMDYLQQMPDKCIQLALVDPPYGINMAKWDKSIPKQDYWDELFRVSKNQIVWGGNYFNLPHTEGWICWDKTFNDDLKGGKLTQRGCPRENMSDFELLWTSFDMKAKFIRFTQIGNLIGFCKNIKVDYEHQSKIHPTQKHVLLYKKILQDYAKPGDKILDTHTGSASSLIACEEMGFDYIAFEKDEDYYKAATKRLQQYRSQLKLFV